MNSPSSPAVPLGVSLIASVFSLLSIGAIAGGLYLLFVSVLGTQALALVAPISLFFPAFEQFIQRVTLEVTADDIGSFAVLWAGGLAFVLATIFFSMGSALKQRKPWSRTLIMVFTVIGIANGLARMADRSANGSVPWAIAVGVSLLMLLYLCSPEVAGFFQEDGG